MTDLDPLDDWPQPDEHDPELVDASGLDLIDLGAEPASNGLTDAQQTAAGLRELADFIDANPDLPGLRHTFANVSVFPRDKEGVAAWARAAMKATGKASKLQDGTWAGVQLEFGPDREHTGRPVRIAVRIEREEVCERVVTGTRLETKEVPDPEALAAVPLVTVTETVEDVEWRCLPLLADLTASAGAA